MTDDDIPGLAEARETRGLIDAMDRSFSTLVKRAVFLWVIRWTIAFAAIWGVTSWTGRYEFLWTLGLIIATASLAGTLLAQWILARKFARTREKMDRLETVLREDARETTDSRPG